MSILDIFRSSSVELTIAAGLTILVWFAFAGLYPNERLDLGETTLLLVVLFAAAKAIAAALRWRRGGGERS